MTINWVLICTSFQKTSDNKFDFFGVGDVFTTEGFPADLPNFVIASSWSGNKGDTLELGLDILSPSKKSVIPLSKKQLPFTDPTIYVLMEVPSIMITEQGVYNARLINNKQIHLMPFRVEVTKK